MKKTGSPYPFRIINEPLNGLSNARRRGIFAANYNYILFVDDDNLLDSDYVQKGIAKLESDNEIGILGGWNTATPQEGIELPDWFLEVQEAYSCGNMYGDKDGAVSLLSFIRGAGMFGRKLILKKIFDSSFPLLLGDRSANKLTSGGDIEICMRCKILGYQVYFSKNLHLIHVMKKEKLALPYKAALFQSLAEQTCVLKYYWRFLECQKYSLIKKIGLTLFNFLKWIWAKLARKRYVGDWASSYLYFLTGISLFATSEAITVSGFAAINKPIIQRST